MDITGNTILITGGSSGIGFELAAQLMALGNMVIVTGRDPATLAAAQARLPGLTALQSDAGDPQAVSALYDTVTAAFPALNMLINSAGIMRKINLYHDGYQTGPDLEDVTREITINLNGTIWTTLRFLPYLKTRQNAAVVTISSGLAFVPLPIAPVYCATKAAIHAFTLSLRAQSKNSPVKIFELAPPGTDTPLFTTGFTKEDVAGVKPMPVKTLARHAIAGLKKDVLEIRPGLSNVLKLGSRIAPGFMLGQLGKSVDLMLAEAKA